MPSEPVQAPPPVRSKERLQLGLDPADKVTATQLWITSVFAGAWTGSMIFSGISNLPQRIALPLDVLTVAGGLVGAYALSHKSPRLNGGTLAAIDLGLWAGYVDGWLLALSVMPTNAGSHAKSRVGQGVAGALSNVGGVAAGLLAHKLGATTGDMAILGTTTTWGALSGLFLYFAANPNNAPFGYRGGTTAMLAGSLGGTAVGLGLISKFNFSRTQSWFLDLGGIAGLGVSTAIVEASSRRKSSQAIGGAFLGGELVGLATAATLIHFFGPGGEAAPIALHMVPMLPVMAPNQSEAPPAFVPGLAFNGHF